MDRNKLSLFVICCSKLLIATAPIEVINFTKTEDCGLINHEVNLDPNDSSIQCLRVYFDNFAVATNNKGNIQRNCYMKAKLRIPANTQFRASEAIAEGVYNMAGHAFGGLTLSYELISTNAKGHWFESFRPQTSGDFNFTAKVDNETFTRCLGYDTEIELSSDLHAFIDQREHGLSLISLDETGKRLSWNWQLQTCEADLYGKPFVSYYGAPNGRSYRAIITINNDRGSYNSEGGFTGRLFNIRRRETGHVAEGEWQAQGVRGTFRFNITDARTGKFTGTWHDQHGRQGNWWGEYQ